MPKIFENRFHSFLAAQYGVEKPEDLPVRQRLEIEDAWYAGALIGFHQGFGADDSEILAADAELKAFGQRIVDRYAKAGLPLGQRRS